MDIMYRHPAGVSEEKETAGRLEAIGQEVRKAAKELLEEAQMERGRYGLSDVLPVRSSPQNRLLFQRGNRTGGI